MPSNVLQPLSATERAQYAALTLYSIIKTLAILPFRILFTPWPVRRSVFLQALRGSRPLRRLNLKAFNPPTGQALETYFQKHGQPLQCVDVDCGAQFPSCTIHQISLATASPGPRCSLVFFHGGGYLSPLAGNAHCPMALSIASAAKCASVFFLEYNLAPEAPYPTQLVQAAYALMYLMRDRQIPPEQLVLAGDSVGAHLILSILAHAVQSHPLAPPIGPWVNKAHSFRAAALISPLVQATSSWDSFAENDGRDYLGYENIDRIAKGWAPSSSEVYANLLLPPTTDFWTNEIPVKDICVTVGKWECLRDQALQMAELLGAQVGKSTRKLIIGEKEVHVMSLVDTLAGVDPQPGGSARELFRWLSELP